MVRVALRFASVWPLVAALGCASELPRPPVTAHHWSEFEPVESPPPVPRPEPITAAPRENAVWVDGYWVSRGGIWIWREGGWVIAPAGSRIAVWKLIYDRSGRVLYAPSVWRDQRGKLMDPPAFLDARHQRRRDRRAKRRQKRLRQRELMR